MVKRKKAEAAAPMPAAALLETVTVPIADLNPDPENARTHPERNIQALQASLERFGQRKPIVVQRDGMVVRAGNGLLEAAKRLGWAGISAVIVDDTDADARAFAIADNRSGELSAWDYTVLSEQLEDLQAGWDGFSPDALGFSQMELDSLLSTLRATEADPIQPGQVDEPAAEEPAADVGDMQGENPGIRIPLVFYATKDDAAYLHGRFRLGGKSFELDGGLLLALTRWAEEQSPEILSVLRNGR